MNDDALPRILAALTLKQQNQVAFSQGTPTSTATMSAAALAKNIQGTSVPACPVVNNERLSLGEVINNSFSL